MKPKTGLLILVHLLIGITATAFLAMRNTATPEDQRAERIIDAYLLEKDIQVRLGTKAYSQIMKGILLGEYPELTDVRFGYLENPEDVEIILNYAASNLNVPLNAIDGTDIPEALLPTP